MSSRFFRPLILLTTLATCIWYCTGEGPVTPPLSTPDKSERLIIFCDQEIISTPELLQKIENDILQTLFTDIDRPLKIDLYALDHRTEQAMDLLGTCKIDAADVNLMKEGSWKMKNRIRSRCAEAFGKIRKPSEQGCNKILSSLHVMSQVLRGIDADTDVRVIYYSKWMEMDATADFDQHQYRMRGNNPIGGIYPFEYSVLEELMRQLHDPDSPLRKNAARLKSTIDAQGLPLSKVYSIDGFESKFSDDRNADAQIQLDIFWDSLFVHAGLNRVRVSSFQDSKKE